MSFDSAWHQLFPGLLSPRLDAATPSAADDFFGFSDPTVALPDGWSSTASVDSAASTMDTRAAPSPKPKAKPRPRRTSTRRTRSVSKLSEEAIPDNTEPVNQASPTTKTTKKPSSSPAKVPSPFQQPPGQYQYKPIMVRDMNSVPVMFKNMPSVITQAPVLPNIGPKGGHPDNILLMIAPQSQLNGKRRKTSVPTAQSNTKLRNPNFVMPQQRLRSKSEPFLTEPTPNGLRTDQQVADFKRRKMMQFAYEQMESLVPQKFYDKPSRANVLMGAVDYITQLKATVREMELRLAAPLQAQPNKELTDKPKEESLKN